MTDLLQAVKDALWERMGQQEREHAYLLRGLRRRGDRPEMVAYRIEVLLTMCPEDLKDEWRTLRTMHQQVIKLFNETMQEVRRG